MIDTSEYISLYDLLMWASQQNDNDLLDGNQDLLNIIQEQQTEIPTYTFYNGIKPRIKKNHITLTACLNMIKREHGFYEDIPF
ncbi:hypothetical protein [Otariodibacter oris]|uniref:Uncharacterized protein n=1 Tax=Otariodibacter oris TaxID=1032623 RepID=A0A420XEY4_9PAST|nr:hypothetical protein [Otariodibacter oris]QGM81487.1 hypothetical protein A6A10_08750 [Otariodibacter oris]RKR71093.1 hypothetical protein DES31_1671 [Otariodibacter oris]